MSDFRPSSCVTRPFLNLFSWMQKGNACLAVVLWSWNEIIYAKFLPHGISLGHCYQLLLLSLRLRNIHFSWNQDIRSTCHVQGAIQNTQSFLTPSLPIIQITVSSLFTVSLRSHTLSYFWAFCLLLLLYVKIPSPSSLWSPNITHSFSSFRTPHRHPLLREAFPDTHHQQSWPMDPSYVLPRPFMSLPLGSSYHSACERLSAYLFLLAPSQKKVSWFSGPRANRIAVFQDNPLHSLGPRSLHRPLLEITEDS